MCAPSLAEYIPVIIENLLGAQTPTVEYALVYLTPSAASLSRFGVLTTSLPYDPNTGPMSSQLIHTTLSGFWVVFIFSEHEKNRGIISNISFDLSILIVEFNIVFIF